MRAGRPFSRVLVAAALLATAPALGCKIISAIIELPSDISAASSRSIAGSFDAMSKSSGSGGGNKAETTPNKLSYSRDLAFTAAFANLGQPRGVPAVSRGRRGPRRQSLGPTPDASRSAKVCATRAGARRRWRSSSVVGRDNPAGQLALEGYRHAGG
jgi:hypothetical protein